LPRVEWYIYLDSYYEVPIVHFQTRPDEMTQWHIGPVVLCGPCATIRLALLQRMVEASPHFLWGDCHQQDELADAYRDVLEAWKLASGLVPSELDLFQKF
jgi:hypothetical protein